MKVNTNWLILSLAFSVCGYCLTSQIIFLVFCFLIASADYLFWIRKTGIEQAKVKKEEQFKSEYMFHYLLRYENDNEITIKETLSLFESRYTYLDKEELSLLIIKELKNDLDNRFIDAKKKKKTKSFYSLLRTEAINNYYSYLKNKEETKNRNEKLVYNILVTFLCLIILRFFINDIYQTMLLNKFYYFAIVILLGVIWIICRTSIMQIGEEEVYEKEN